MFIETDQGLQNYNLRIEIKPAMTTCEDDVNYKLFAPTFLGFCFLICHLHVIPILITIDRQQFGRSNRCVGQKWKLECPGSVKEVYSYKMSYSAELMFLINPTNAFTPELKLSVQKLKSSYDVIELSCAF